jgi:hypothetical protein
MRAATLLLLLFAACNPQNAPLGSPEFDSVRERFEQTRTQLFVSAADSAGTITAQRRVAGGMWESGLVDLGFDQGELVATATGDGAITIERLDVTLAPIAIPASVFGHPAELANVRAQLAAPVRVATTWSDADSATATAEVELAMSWALRVNGSTTQLGSPDLPPVEVRLAVDGTGDFVHAELRAGVTGEIWSWADLIKLADLQLVIAAETK